MFLYGRSWNQIWDQSAPKFSNTSLVIRVGFFTAALALVQIRRESFQSGAASERNSSDRYDYFKKAK